MNTGGDVADAMARTVVDASAQGARVAGELGIKMLLVLYTVLKDVKIKRGNKLECRFDPKDMPMIEQLLSELNALQNPSKNNNFLTQALQQEPPPPPAIRRELTLEHAEIGERFVLLREVLDSFTPKENEPHKFEVTVHPEKAEEARSLLEQLGLIEPKNQQALALPSKSKSTERGLSSPKKTSVTEKVEAMKKASKSFTLDKNKVKPPMKKGAR